MMKKAVIFDVDGTLWDSVDPIAKAWNMVCRKYQDSRRVVINREILLGLMGKTMDKFEDALMPPEMPAERAHEVMAECMNFENDYLREHGAILLGDVADVFRKLHEMGYGVCIVSNCQSGYIEAFVEHYQLETLVDDIECYGNTGEGKAENLRRLIGRNQLTEYCYLGDTQGDYDACREAGVPFIWASYGFGTVDADVRKIDTLAQLLNIL